MPYSIEFFVEGVPVPWHRTGQNRYAQTTFKVKADVVWQKHVHNQSILNRPMVLPLGPVILDLTFMMPRPKKHKKGVHYYFTKRPDLDNLTKSIKDAINLSMYKDDSQVVEERLRKVFVPDGQKPGVLVTVSYILEDRLENKNQKTG